MRPVNIKACWLSESARKNDIAYDLVARSIRSNFSLFGKLIKLTVPLSNLYNSMEGVEWCLGKKVEEIVRNCLRITPRSAAIRKRKRSLSGLSVKTFRKLCLESSLALNQSFLSSFKTHLERLEMTNLEKNIEIVWFYNELDETYNFKISYTHLNDLLKWIWICLDIQVFEMLSIVLHCKKN